MTLVKLCGLRNRADVETVNLLLPDFAGFVFARGSPRYVEPRAAKDLVHGLDPGVTPVGVFLDAPPSYIEACCRISGVRTVQVHGEFDDRYVKQVRELTGLPVIQAFKVASSEDVRRAVSSTADVILLDNGYGGTGRPFDRSLLEGVDRDYVLAGGLTPDNVKNTIESVHPYAVDVSTGIETNGLKDPAKMAAFMDAVHEADFREHKVRS